ncbi:MAG TPA: hypothetical protein VMP11_16800 [Verrucomicrobiae bacterium]|nr:hypothetical protein [Verrucomicrobiae bacterium]
MPQNVDLLMRCRENLNRVNSLVRVYESHPDSKGKGRKDVQTTDVLRASVVLLHAAFEDMCRTIERELLPFASEEPLLTLGSAPLRHRDFLSAVLRQRGEGRSQAAIHADIASSAGQPRSHAEAPDEKSSEEAGKTAIHQRVMATAEQIAPLDALVSSRFFGSERQKGDRPATP